MSGKLMMTRRRKVPFTFTSSLQQQSPAGYAFDIMKAFHRILLAATLLAFLTGNSVPRAVADSAQPAPGPENGGLRMRLIIAPDKIAETPAQRVKIELLNVTDKPVTLRSAWEHDEQTGNMEDYLESATGIETYPAIEPWSGQVMVGRRSRPQEEKILKAGETVTVSWQTDGRRLKNKVVDPLSVQNPDFPVPGLYSVHAVLHLPTAAGMVLLRSNEQQFAAGDSAALPKSTFGQIISVEMKSNFGQINLGTIHQVKTGDQFRIRTGYSEYYRLTITRTEPSWSGGTLAPEPLTPDDSRASVPFPSVGQGAVWTQEPPVKEQLEKEKAAKVPVVLRVQFISESGSDKYGWSKVRLAAQLKNESNHTFPREFEVAHVSTEPGVPAGASTIYLERYNPESEDRWKLLDGSGKSGVSHHKKP